MKRLYFLAFVFVFASCKDTKKADYIDIQEAVGKDKVATDVEHPGQKIMETECYICHDATTPEENRLGPPMVAIKRRYLMGGKTKVEFVNDIVAWVAKPTQAKAKMYGAVDRFGVMPYLPYPEENIRQIAEYLHDHEISQPEWFEDHYRENHGNNMGKGQGKGLGAEQANRQNKTIDDYADSGLKYALATKALLGKNLIKAIQEKGTVGAVEFCNLNALKLTDSMSIMNNALIKRVSDKARNPENMANAKELEHIRTFKELVKDRSEIDPIVEETQGAVNFYYPIVTNTMCLLCHGKTNGSEVKSEVLTKLKELYPRDKALGYSVNEVRGIWSIGFAK